LIVSILNGDKMEGGKIIKTTDAESIMNLRRNIAGQTGISEEKVAEYLGPIINMIEKTSLRLEEVIRIEFESVIIKSENVNSGRYIFGSVMLNVMNNCIDFVEECAINKDMHTKILLTIKDKVDGELKKINVRDFDDRYK